ncbi:MAG: polysaccharide deacetylase family protein [Actinobacteria bacterium]|nr:polysaccharide deacetylase family protein [Actinomycetota bacterium]
MARARRSLRGFHVLVASIVFLVPFLVAGDLRDLPAPIGVTVGKEVHYVPPETTFADLVEEFGLEARDGDFLDVEGEIIEVARFPGRVLLNGRETISGTELEEGDRIVVKHGRDQTESTVIEYEETPSRVPSNPQFYLGTSRGELVITRGRVSGKVVSTVFHQIGPTQTPQAVALTFDDGPHPTYTPKVLRILKKYKVPATFFVIGTWAENYPELIQQELLAGHVVAHHSWSHPTPPEYPPFSDLPDDQLETELTKAYESLQSVGATPFLFRPPGGSYSDALLAEARDMGMRLVLWAEDPEDWRSDATSTSIANYVLDNVDAGDIILLHDGGGYQDATVAALPRIIKGVRKLGLEFVSIGRSAIEG